jgi:hypothetical protein
LTPPILVDPGRRFYLKVASLSGMLFETSSLASCQSPSVLPASSGAGARAAAGGLSLLGVLFALECVHDVTKVPVVAHGTPLAFTFKLGHELGGSCSSGRRLSQLIMTGTASGSVTSANNDYHCHRLGLRYARLCHRWCSSDHPFEHGRDFRSQRTIGVRGTNAPAMPKRFKRFFLQGDDNYWLLWC